MYQEDWTDSNERQLMCEIPSVIHSLDTEVPRTQHSRSPQRVRHAACCVSPSAMHWWSVIPWRLWIPTISFMFRCSVKNLNYNCFSFVRISSDHPLCKTSRASKPSSTYSPTYHRVPHRTYHGTPRTFLTSLTSVWRSSPVRQNIHGCMHDHFLCKSPNTLCRRRCRNNNVSTPHLVLSADEMFFPEPKTRIFCSIPRRATEFKKQD